MLSLKQNSRVLLRTDISNVVVSPIVRQIHFR